MTPNQVICPFGFLSALPDDELIEDSSIYGLSTGPTMFNSATVLDFDATSSGFARAHRALAKTSLKPQERGYRISHFRLSAPNAIHDLISDALAVWQARQSFSVGTSDLTEQCSFRNLL
jgi:hypothetical protein